MYRTYANIGGGVNLGVHTWLLSLERTYLLEQRLPDTLYHQIDGGCENTAKIMMCKSYIITNDV